MVLDSPALPPTEPDPHREQGGFTEEEKRALVKYVGWGGIPQVFAWHAATDWEGEREKLNALLTLEEYEAARASTLNAHYTSATVINGIAFWSPRQVSATSSV